MLRVLQGVQVNVISYSGFGAGAVCSFRGGGGLWGFLFAEDGFEPGGCGCGEVVEYGEKGNRDSDKRVWIGTNFVRRGWGINGDGEGLESRNSPRRAATGVMRDGILIVVLVINCWSWCVEMRGKIEGLDEAEDEAANI